MIISPLVQFKVNNLSFKSQTRELKKSSPQIGDTFEIISPEKLHERNIQKIVSKLTDGDITKEYLDNFLQSYDGEDREIAKEILALSAQNLTFNGCMNSMYELFANDINRVIFLKIDSNVSDFLSYIHRRHAHINPSHYPHVEKMSLKELNKKDPTDVCYVTEGIFNRELSDKEIEVLAKVKKLKVLNLGFFEIMPNFIDFAISDEKAKEKIDKILHRVKKIKRNEPNLSTREAIEKSNNYYFELNKAKYLKARKKLIDKWKQEHEEFVRNELNQIDEIKKARGYSLDIISQEIALQRPFDIPKELDYVCVDFQCDNYENIDEYLNLFISPVYNKKKLKDREYKKITPENLKQKIGKGFSSPKQTVSLLASNEFTYYTPKKFIIALRELIQKFECELKKDGKSLKNCIFWYNDGKSEAFIGYLLEEMGLISQKQRAKIGNDKASIFKTNVFIDDIVGSGYTANKAARSMMYNQYCLSIVSCDIGRKLLDNSIKKRHLYYQDSFNAQYSKFNEARKFSVRNAGPVDECNSSEIFFFSYPDNCYREYCWFASRVLKLNAREDEDWS